MHTLKTHFFKVTPFTCKPISWISILLLKEMKIQTQLGLEAPP